MLLKHKSYVKITQMTYKNLSFKFLQEFSTSNIFSNSHCLCPIFFAIKGLEAYHVQSYLFNTTLDNTTTSILWHKFRKPNFLVQIYLYTTTMTMLIRHS
jgi:hypothetical protein